MKRYAHLTFSRECVQPQARDLPTVTCRAFAVGGQFETDSQKQLALIEQVYFLTHCTFDSVNQFAVSAFAIRQ